MSDGGGKNNGKETDHNNSTGNNDFMLAIARIAVAQVCESEGFQGFQQSALESLTDVTIRYIREIGKIANLAANSAGRSESNVFDVILGLEDLGSIQGFSGNSDVYHSLHSSGTITEISQYVNMVEEIPFAYSLPRFPVSREHKHPPSFCQLGDEPPGEHIPPWLPAFPRPQNRLVFTNNGGEEQEKVPKKEELHQGFTNNRSEAGFGAIDIDINPFLAPPLSSSEKEVSSIGHLSRFSDGGGVANHVNVMETFGINTNEEGQNKLSETKEGSRNIGLGERPSVRLKFNSVRKNVIAQDNGDGKLANCFERDDEKDEKKQRAEQILKESVENPLGSSSVVN